MNDIVNILIVNQNKNTSEMVEDVLKAHLTQFSLEFTIVDSICAGKYQIKDGNHYDLVMNGLGNDWDGNPYKFIEEVKEKGYLSIVMSGYGDNAKYEAIRNGADGYISLPDISQIPTVVKAVLETRLSSNYSKKKEMDLTLV